MTSGDLDHLASLAGDPEWRLDDGTLIAGRAQWSALAFFAWPWERARHAYHLARSQPFLEVGAGKTNMALLAANPPPPRPAHPDARLASIARDLREVVIGDEAFIPELAAAGARLPWQVLEHALRVSVIVAVGINERGYVLAHALPAERFVVVLGPSHVAQIFSHECSHVFHDLIPPAINSKSGYFQSHAWDERGRVARAADEPGRQLEAEYAQKEVRARLAAAAWLLPDPDAGPEAAAADGADDPGEARA